mmetsp:Transcript_37720/g.70342  ORF Transcript_37720/g.70342 Transcript_37720/m.70342 type:complete len:371 (+) Transcript_37720:61-1173(+)
MWSGLSWALGALDNAYTLTHLRTQRPRFFADGWGDVPAAQAAQEALFDRKPEAPLAIEWDAPKANVCCGRFRSPFAERLPEEVQEASFVFVSPLGPDGMPVSQPWSSGSSAMGAQPSAIVLLLPATGEENLDGRVAIAQKLARENSMCSLVVAAPFYGHRKPKGQQMHFVRTVEKYLDQSNAIVEESAALISWCTGFWPTVPVCISGYSWGGAMTCVTALVASQWEPSAQILAVPYAGSATPAVLVDGLLQDDIQWPALVKNEDETFQVTHDTLMNVLLQTNLSSVVGPLEAAGKANLSGLHAVSFENDGFVKPEYGEDLFALTSKCCKPGAKRVLSWQAGGHVYAFLARQRVQTAAIQSACSSLSTSRL